MRIIYQVFKTNGQIDVVRADEVIGLKNGMVWFLVKRGFFKSSVIVAAYAPGTWESVRDIKN